MSTHLFNMPVEDFVGMRGPIGSYTYKSHAQGSLVMCAAGTGLTPMLQVAQELLNIVEDETKLSLLFCNVTPADIYLKAELDELAELFPERFSVTYARQPHAPMCSNICLPVWLPVWLRGCLPVAWWCAVHC